MRATTRGLPVLTRLRTLTPDQALAVRVAFRGGASARELAAQYDVSTRCIYRTLQRASNPTRDVRLGGYRAMFEMTEEGPLQVTAWVPA